MKVKISLAILLSSAAIASGVLLGPTNAAQPCGLKSRYYRQKQEQVSWLRTPWALLLTLPGIAMATALSRGGRSYQS